jgi:homoserine dehydrogenase
MFSRTLGFILSELEKLEKPFSQIVREAKQL